MGLILSIVHAFKQVACTGQVELLPESPLGIGG